MILPVYPIHEIYFKRWQEKTTTWTLPQACQPPENNDRSEPILNDKEVDVRC